MDVVKIDERLISRFGNREWGLPTLRMPGKIWRTESNATISCMIADGPEGLKIETLPLEIVPAGGQQFMPDHWRDAIWEYVQEWPSSGMEYGPFVRLTNAQRCDFIREQAKRLVEADNIGARSIAHNIGAFAAWEYEIAGPVNVI